MLRLATLILLVVGAAAHGVLLALSGWWLSLLAYAFLCAGVVLYVWWYLRVGERAKPPHTMADFTDFIPFENVLVRYSWGRFSAPFSVALSYIITEGLRKRHPCYDRGFPVYSEGFHLIDSGKPLDYDFMLRESDIELLEPKVLTEQARKRCDYVLKRLYDSREKARAEFGAREFSLDIWQYKGEADGGRCLAVRLTGWK